MHVLILSWYHIGNNSYHLIKMNHFNIFIHIPSRKIKQRSMLLNCPTSCNTMNAVKIKMGVQVSGYSDAGTQSGWWWILSLLLLLLFCLMDAVADEYIAVTSVASLLLHLISCGSHLDIAIHCKSISLVQDNSLLLQLNISEPSKSWSTQWYPHLNCCLCFNSDFNFKVYEF